MKININYNPSSVRESTSQEPKNLKIGSSFVSVRNIDEVRFTPYIPTPDYEPSTTKKVRVNPYIPEPDYESSTPRKVRFSNVDLGRKIGAGGNANVYESASNTKDVIKIFKEKVSIKDVTHEINCFCKCYGEGSASIIKSNNEIIGIKMKKIHGKPLNTIDKLPEKARFKFESMLENMESIGILHGDLTESNIIYDVNENEFKFIDISSYSKEYGKSKSEYQKKYLLQAYDGSRDYIINYVNKKISIQADKFNLDNASSSSALKLGNVKLAENVREDKILYQLKDNASFLVKNYSSKISVADDLIEKKQGNIDKRIRKSNITDLLKSDTPSNTTSSTVPSLETKLKIESFDKPKHDFLGKGGRGTVYRSGNMVIKDLNGASNDQKNHELNMCNAWHKENGYTANQASYLVKNHLQMPYREGKFPNNEKVKTVVSEMFKKGFMIGDQKKENFVVDKHGTIHPIDFGLVFQRSDIDNVASDVATEIVKDYAKGGYKLVPAELKSDYSKYINQLESKCHALGTVNIKELIRAGLVSIVKNN